MGNTPGLKPSKERASNEVKNIDVLFMKKGGICILDVMGHDLKYKGFFAIFSRTFYKLLDIFNRFPLSMFPQFFDILIKVSK